MCNDSTPIPLFQHVTGARSLETRARILTGPALLRASCRTVGAGSLCLTVASQEEERRTSCPQLDTTRLMNRSLHSARPKRTLTGTRSKPLLIVGTSVSTHLRRRCSRLQNDQEFSKRRPRASACLLADDDRAGKTSAHRRKASLVLIPSRPNSRQGLVGRA